MRLAPRYYGSFQVLQKFGVVAYQLDVLFTSKIHPIFQVSSLKKKLGHHICPLPTLPLLVDSEGTILPKLERILERRMKHFDSNASSEVLIKCVGVDSKENS